MRNRAAAAWFALALGSGAFPLDAAAQEVPVDARRESIARAIELAEASRPSMPSDQKADTDEPPAPSATIALLTNWVTATGDNGGLPFMIIDKVAAEVAIFDAQGQFVGLHAGPHRNHGR